MGIHHDVQGRFRSVRGVFARINRAKPTSLLAVDLFGRGGDNRLRERPHMPRHTMLIALALTIMPALALAVEPVQDSEKALPQKQQATPEPKAEKPDDTAQETSKRPGLRVNHNYMKLGIANDAFTGSAWQR